MTTPAVSVVMSVLDGELYLAEAIESILSQSFGDFEFIVLNDGSTDSSGVILESYRKKDPRIRIVDEEHCGLAKSLNRGCAMARGKYIARTDADDIAIIDRLMRQVSFMEEHPDTGVLGGAVQVIDPTGKALEISVNPIGDSEIRSALLRGHCPFWHPSIVMRKDVYVTTGGYRNAVIGAEDHDLWLRMADHCRLANLETVVLKYRLHPGQVTVLKRRQHAISFLAVQASAAARSKGKTDPLDSIEALTPELLAQIGVSDATLSAELTEKYLRSISTMCNAGQYSVALDILDEVFRSPDWKHASIRSIADIYLLAARAFWHDGRYVRSINNAGRAFIKQPFILGRPLKRILQKVWHHGPHSPTSTMRGQ
jgi:glycosyltransferase involved in cell wall biosynthesis